MTALPRHSLAVRVAHWINAIAFLFLAVSGVGILLGHPQFYWGETGYFGMEPWLKLWFEPSFEQTSWGRNLHFLFAWAFVVNGVVYVVAALVSGYAKRRLLPTRGELAPRNAIADIAAHLKFRRPPPGTTAGYNLLQKTSYLVVIFVLAPVMLLTGMAMSPGFVAAFPDLTVIFGGRQSARSIHFIVANLLVLFFLVHLVEIALAGAVGMLRGMITGRIAAPEEPS
jgi:thiosulfate reductase cytochrome b subunit